jgi:hypothetical protein
MKRGFPNLVIVRTAFICLLASCWSLPGGQAVADNLIGPTDGPGLPVRNPISVNVPGTRDQDNRLTVTLPLPQGYRVSGLGGQVCLAGAGIVCTGPEGISANECNQATDECICPDECGNGMYGALMRDNCVLVSEGEFLPGDGSAQFFVNGDCNPANNTGSFNFSLVPLAEDVFDHGFEE